MPIDKQNISPVPAIFEAIKELLRYAPKARTEDIELPKPQPLRWNGDIVLPKDKPDVRLKQK